MLCLHSPSEQSAVATARCLMESGTTLQFDNRGNEPSLLVDTLLYFSIPAKLVRTDRVWRKSAERPS